MNSTVSDKYIESFPDDIQKTLRLLRTTIRKAAPDAKESIKYGIITYILNGNLVHFGGFKKHIRFYPATSGINTSKRSCQFTKFQEEQFNFRMKNHYL
jgi:uncharacterized protein YdhG (YjbR/CyaY superfamily)